MNKATLCFLVKKDKVLLAMKKRGFGEGKWNGIGGKLDINTDNTVEDCARREVNEEIGVVVSRLCRTGHIRFTYLAKTEWNQAVTIYTIPLWTGEPQETEEMAPRWFNTWQIPLKQMWEDDVYWLPQVLRGKWVVGECTFGAQHKLQDHDLRFI